MTDLTREPDPSLVSITNVTYALHAVGLAIGAFGASMFVFDAFAFIQATILFFVIAALGLQARRLGPRPADS